MAFAIEKFSSVLCFAYGTIQEDSHFSPQCFVLTDNSECVHNVIQKLRTNFENELYPIVEKLVEIGEIESFDSFMKATLSCCVKMAETPTYLTFLLLCSLVLEVVTKSFISQHCFCLTAIASVCLNAVYYRCYNNVFRRSGKFTSLGIYCQRLNSSLENWIGINQLPIDDQEKSRAAFERVRVRVNDYNDFSLTNFEKKLLNDCLNFLPTEDCHDQDDEVTTSSSFENNSSLTDVLRPDKYDLVATQRNLPEDAITTTVPSAINATNVQENPDSSKSEDDSFEDGVLCFKCRKRCFKYLEAFQMQFSAEINEVNNE